MYGPRCFHRQSRRFAYLNTDRHARIAMIVHDAKVARAPTFHQGGGFADRLVWAGVELIQAERR